MPLLKTRFTTARRPKHSERRGVAIVTVLGLLAIVLALSYALLRTQGTTNLIARNSSRQLDARLAAEAGVAAALRKMLKEPGLVMAPGVADALMAKIVAKVGFKAIYMTGAGTSAVRLGKPDIGLMTMTEMADNAQRIADSSGLPLIADAPRDIGVDDFCTRCQVCSSLCPPDAIYPEKQLVRGEMKWYVDFDKCIPYFNDTLGCGICIAECPWSLPGVAPKLTQKMLRRKTRQTER